VVWVVLGIASAVPLFVLVLAQTLGLDPHSFQGAAFRVTPLYMGIFLTIALLSCVIPMAVSRWVHGRPLRFAWQGRSAGRHLLIGALLAASTVAIRLSGHADLGLRSSLPAGTAWSEWVTAYGVFLGGILLITSVREELIFRAYPLTALTDTGRKRLMWVAVSATLFAVTHLILEPPTVAGFSFRFVFGLLAGLVFLADGFWGAVGLHAGWNWVSGTFSPNWRMGGLWTISGEAPVWDAYVSTTVVGVAIFVLYRRLPDPSAARRPPPPRNP
jgi:membrane protease YdiL (CAAX protease family)